MMYTIIADTLRDCGLLHLKPTDYLNFYCLGARETMKPGEPGPLKPPDAKSKQVSNMQKIWIALLLLAVELWFSELLESFFFCQKVGRGMAKGLEVYLFSGTKFSVACRWHKYVFGVLQTWLPIDIYDILATEGSTKEQANDDICALQRNGCGWWVCNHWFCQYKSALNGWIKRHWDRYGRLPTASHLGSQEYGASSRPGESCGIHYHKYVPGKDLVVWDFWMRFHVFLTSKRRLNEDSNAF